LGAFEAGRRESDPRECSLTWYECQEIRLLIWNRLKGLRWIHVPKRPTGKFFLVREAMNRRVHIEAVGDGR